MSDEGPNGRLARIEARLDRQEERTDAIEKARAAILAWLAGVGVIVVASLIISLLR